MLPGSVLSSLGLNLALNSEANSKQRKLLMHALCLRHRSPASLVSRIARHIFVAAIILFPAVQLARADNLAPLGSGIMGFNSAINTNLGTMLFHGGVRQNINDQNLSTSVDDFSGGSDAGQGVSFVG